MDNGASGVSRKLVMGKGGLRMAAVDGQPMSPFEMEEPKWLSDQDHDCCMDCRKKFSLLVRRHHCRRCGRIYCSECCCGRSHLPRISYVDPQRVCKICIAVAGKEFMFFTKHLRILVDGAALLVNGSPSSVECRLCQKLHDKLILNCQESDQGALEGPLYLKDIVMSENIIDENERFCGIIIKMKDGNDAKKVKFTVEHGAKSEKRTLAFLEALRQALEILFDVQ